MIGKKDSWIYVPLAEQFWSLGGEFIPEDNRPYSWHCFDQKGSDLFSVPHLFVQLRLECIILNGGWLSYEADPTRRGLLAFALALPGHPGKVFSAFRR